MDTRQKIKLRKVLGVAIACSFFGLIFGFQEVVISGIINPQKIEIGYYSIVLQLISGLIAGGVLGSIEIFFLRDYFRKKSFGFALLIESAFFVSVFLVITFLASYAYQIIIFNHPTFSSETFFLVIDYFSGIGMLINFINWSLAFVIILFVLQIADNFGLGILPKFILGKYHTPKEEERIFMFFDLNSSTQIGEQLTNIQYHSLLNDWFADLTDPIINNDGEIYQYVGDEISASWKFDNIGSLESCIKCYFDIQEKLKEKEVYYKSKYTFLPRFSTGLHGGKVTTGEVGIIKKEIVFSGDVLNTTSRLTNTCKKYDVGILVSNELLEKFTVSDNYDIIKVDSLKLRGKEKDTTIFTINKKKN